MINIETTTDETTTNKDYSKLDLFFKLVLSTISPLEFISILFSLLLYFWMMFPIKPISTKSLYPFIQKWNIYAIYFGIVIAPFICRNSKLYKGSNLFSKTVIKMVFKLSPFYNRYIYIWKIVL